jgi:aspartokinase/homoserine dehydrogenase 1
MRILKFGGTSLDRPGRVRAVVEILARSAAEEPTIAVVSAMAGVTDDLESAARGAAVHQDGYRDTLAAIEARHRAAVRELVPERAREEVDAVVDDAFVDLHDVLHGVSLVRECTVRTLDRVLSYGELLSSTIVAAALRAAGQASQARDPRDFIVTDDRFGAARVDWERTRLRVRDVLSESGDTMSVVGGFVGATARGETTTLGRGGSDYTAALLGAALKASRVEIWTDVDGVMSADPRLVSNAFALPSLSYHELAELSHFGAKVVFPPSVRPTRDQSIPLVIRNTLAPELEGTRITDRSRPQKGHPIRGISSINEVALLRLEGVGMVGESGVAARLFGALARERISVILISQASSEHSICFAVQPQHAGRAQRALQDEFELERRVGLVDAPVVESGLSVIAAVGDGMRETPGIAGRLFSTLGDHDVNVRAIAQGSSELNISLVVAKEDEVTALRAIHDAFFAAKRVDARKGAER